MAAALLKGQGGTHAEIADTLLLLKKSGYKPGQLRALTGLKDYQVRHYLLIAKKLIPAVKALLHEGKIKYSLARAIASVAPEQQEEVARKAIMSRTSVHRLRAELNAGQAFSNQAEREYFEKIAINMSEQTGLLVTIAPSPVKRNSGNVLLHYSTLEDFDTICERLGIDTEQF